MNSLFIRRKYARHRSRKRKSFALLISGMLLLFLLTGTNGYSQVETNLEPFLLLEKPGTKNRIRYYIGDEIEFLLKDEKKFHKGTIVQFSDTSFYVNGFAEVPLRTVEALADRSKVKGIHAMAKNTLFVIPVFFIFSGANNLFNTGDTPIIDEEVYPLSVVFLAISGAGFLYKGRRYRLKNRWRIIMVRL